METKQMTPFFPSTFSALTVLTFVSEFENTQNSYSFMSILVCKKSLDLKVYHTFLEVDTLRWLKITIMFCPLAGPNINLFRLQLMDYIQKFWGHKFSRFSKFKTFGEINFQEWPFLMILKIKTKKMIYVNEKRHLDFYFVFLSLLFIHFNKICNN